MPTFPSETWLQALHEKLNTDEQYARMAAKWEGDLAFVIEPSGPLDEMLVYYLDLWHGKCRGVGVYTSPDEIAPAFVLRAPYENFARILQGELDPMQAMLTRKLHVKGNMAVMMRSVPVVLDFVRCAREVTEDILR